MRVLAGDIGGTKTLLALVETRGNALTMVREQRFDSRAYPDFTSILTLFFAQTDLSSDDLQGACLAVAGPIQEEADGRVVARVTNLPWVMDREEIAARTGIPSLRLINDFQGVGQGIPALSATDKVALQTGTSHPRAPIAVIGAGTGLGHALLVPGSEGAEARVFSSEGGHVGFAPEDETQQALRQYLAQEFPRVTPEHIVSGAGLARIFRFFQISQGVSVGPRLNQALASAADPAVEITRFALAGEDECARLALDLFCRIYGSQAANFALITLATGGVYLAGGIAPKILPALQNGGFLEGFLQKSPMSHLLEAMPVWVVTQDKIGLLGAARVARNG